MIKKHIITFLTFNLLLGQVAWSDALDTPEQAKRVKIAMEATVLSMDGVNAIGITGCNPETGEMDTTNDFVHCVFIGAETLESYRSLSTLYPPPTQVEGVFITVDYMGTISPEPRISVSN